MNRVILFLMVMIIGLAAHADYTVQTSQPLYPNPYVDPALASPYVQQYNQAYYQNPYQYQYQGQCVNPYQYRNPYMQARTLPYTAVNPAVSGLGTNTTGGASQVVRNIGQSMLYSMLRGY